MKHRVSLAIAALVAVVTLACALTGGPGGEEAAEATQPPPAGPAGEATAAPEATRSPEPEPEETAVRAADGMEMVRIPAGEFLMGDDASAFAPEKPAHTVYLDAYWIDRTEVTNTQYRQCVEAGTCPEPEFWWNEELNGDNQPVLVPWEGARTYCEWVGARLPTEAEWEKAVRGTDGRTWPWGNEFEPNRANLSGDEDGYGPTAPVGSFPGDVSPYGLLDAAGNAGEWVADWYDAQYYAHSPARNPTGPASGDQRVHRAPIANAGGGPEKCRSVARYGVDPNYEYGFRCVSDTPPEGGEAAATQPPEATPTLSSEQPPSGGDEEQAAWVPLESYRNITIMRMGGPDGPVESEFTAAWDAATSASRYTIGPEGQVAVEEVTIGADRWSRGGQSPWQRTTLTPEDQAAWEQKVALAQLWGDANELAEDLEAVLPEGVELVPAQIFPLDIKAALVYDGEETVNGVHCRRYTVDTDLDYTQDLPGGGERHTTGHATGVIWIADQSGIPPVIVRALMDEDLIIDGEESHPYWEHDIIDINEPVTIEPPE